MGPAGSDTWHAMLDGGEDVLREEGHAQLTSRNIAERIGVKQRLVYYYFHTMEDLIVEMFRRSSARELQQLKEVAASEKPLRKLWEICFHAEDARLISEYMALANRIPDLQAAVVAYIEESRAIQVAAITTALANHPETVKVSPGVLAVMATSIGLSLNREEQLGVKSCHAEVLAVLGKLLDELED